MKSLPRLVLLAALAPAAYSQSVLYTFDGDSTFDEFGASVSGAGDVNGDGFPDLIVGAPFDDNNGPQSGSARVFSGIDGSILYTFDGDSTFDLFGSSVSGAGDVNGDGFDDLIVGAWLDDNNGTESGSARVFSGVDGSILYTFDGDSAEDYFGYSVSGAGDVNGDGFDDLIVGAPRNDNSGYASGLARVFSGVDGSVLYTFEGTGIDRLGHSVSGAGDVNGDGFADVIVGAPQLDFLYPGYIRVFSGADGSILYDKHGGYSDEFGQSVSGAGDVNGDGFDDMIIGETVGDPRYASRGAAYVLSGVDGSYLHIFVSDGSDYLFGFSVSGAGDVNGDGFADIVVGAQLEIIPGKGSGTARVFSGLDGSTLFTLIGEYGGDMFGISVSGAGDVNGDGFDDVIVGASEGDNGGTFAGMAIVFAGSDHLGTIYCSPAVANSSGQPAVISATGSALADGGNFMLHATDLPTHKFGYFLVSATQAIIPNPAGSQGILCIGGNIGRFAKQGQSSGPSGEFTIQVDLTSIPQNPPHTVVAGETWNFQAWFRDKNPGSTTNFTDAVSVLFQ